MLGGDRWSSLGCYQVSFFFQLLHRIHPSGNRLTVLSLFSFTLALLPNLVSWKTIVSFISNTLMYVLKVELISLLSLIAGGVKAILLYAGRDATECVFSITLVL